MLFSEITDPIRLRKDFGDLHRNILLSERILIFSDSMIIYDIREKIAIFLLLL
jgi:hypothetical protein